MTPLPSFKFSAIAVRAPGQLQTLDLASDVASARFDEDRGWNLRNQAGDLFHHPEDREQVAAYIRTWYRVEAGAFVNPALQESPALT